MHKWGVFTRLNLRINYKWLKKELPGELIQKEVANLLGAQNSSRDESNPTILEQEIENLSSFYSEENVQRILNAFEQSKDQIVENSDSDSTNSVEITLSSV